MEIRYDPNDLNAQLSTRLDEFSATVEQARVLSDARLTEARRLAGEAREQLQSTFELVVLGDFKRGKSTVINALLGSAVAPVDVNPETCTINCFEFAKEPKVTGETADGGKVDLKPEQLKRGYLQAFASKLRCVRIGTPAPMLQGMTLVDTPGLGEGFGEFDAIVRDHLREAEAVVYVTSALTPLAQSEQEFLREAVAPLEFPKLCFVVNFLDLLDSREEMDRVMNLIREKLSRMFPNAAIFGLSALDQWKRISGAKALKAPEGVNFEEMFGAFRKHLDESILFNRDLLVTDRAAAGYRKLIDSVEESAQDLQVAMAQSHDQREARIAELTARQKSAETSLKEMETKLRSGMDRLAQKTRGWMREFLSRMDNDCLAGLGTLDSNQIRKHLPLFLSDRIREAVQACMSAQHGEFVTLLDASRKDLAGGFPDEKELASRLALPATRLGDLPWTQMDLVSFASQFLNLDIVTQLLIGFLRDVEHGNLTTALVQKLRGDLPQLQGQVAAEVDRAYAKIAERVISSLRDSYSRELESVLETLRSVRDLDARTAEGQKSVAEGLKAVGTRAEAEGAFLEELKRKLWSGAPVSA